MGGRVGRVGRTDRVLRENKTCGQTISGTAEIRPNSGYVGDVRELGRAEEKERKCKKKLRSGVNRFPCPASGHESKTSQLRFSISSATI